MSTFNDDLSIPAEERLREDFIGSNLQVGLLNASILFDPPEESDLYDKNTRILVNVMKGTKLVNCVAVYYDRNDLAGVFSDFEDNGLDATFPDGTSVSVLFPLILEKFGVNLTEDDVEPDTITDNTFTIRAKETSIGFTGQFTFGQQVLTVWRTDGPAPETEGPPQQMPALIQCNGFYVLFTGYPEPA